MKPRGQRGFALIITLVITALLVAVVTEFIREVYVDTTLRRTWLNAQQASLLADSGITAGISSLQASRLKLEIAQKPMSLRELQPLSLPAPEGAVEVTFEDEGGKLNLNSIAGGTRLNDDAKGIAQRLFSNLDLPGEQLLNTLGDWADEDDATLVNGAESGYYLGLTPPYKCRNRAIETVEELGLVKDYTPEVMTKLRPFVTVYPRTGSSININTAPPGVLMSLHPNMTKDMVERLVEYRKTTTFKDRGEVTQIGIPFSYISTLGDVKGSIYRIHAKATIGEAVRTIEAVVDMTNVQSPKKLYWREF